MALGTIETYPGSVRAPLLLRRPSQEEVERMICQRVWWYTLGGSSVMEFR